MVIFVTEHFKLALICFSSLTEAILLVICWLEYWHLIQENVLLRHNWESYQANHATSRLINGWQETETTMYSCRYMNNHNYGTTCTLNPKKKTWGAGGRGKSGNGRWQQKQLNSKTPCDLKNPWTHESTLLAVCEKNIFCSFCSSASRKPHWRPSS